MRHLGDITKISGYDAPMVDCVIGGSPCQDLSIAGKRAGLAGERSGLFMEQIRIVKEMRGRGRAVDDVRPRYMVWENVPGAFSSNRGQDFAAVLEETIRIAEPEAPGVPVPEKGWSTAGVVVGDGWSVAWRVLDAQFWGVPQRRRRIALVADFGGQSAPEILFVRKGVSGHTEPSGTEGQGFTPGTEKGVDGTSYAVRIMGGCDGGGKGALVQTEVSGTLGCNNDQTIFCLQGNGIDRADTAGCNGKGWKEDVSYTLNTIDRHAVAYSFDSLASNSMRSSNPNSGCREVDVAKTLDTSYPDPSKNQGGIAILDISHRGDVVRECGELVPSLCARAGTGGNNVPVVDRCTDVGFFNSETEKSPTLLARTYKDPHLVSASAKRVRRLTPLECERLQGYPDGWTNIGTWVDSKGRKRETSDAARYKALGNSIALPPWKWVLKRLCAQYERDATMASLFDGIGGFPLIWEQLNGKGSCLWASEVEPFCVAVTERRFDGG